LNQGATPSGESIQAAGVRKPLVDRRPWAFAILYTGLSLGVEIVLIVVFRLKVPENNAIIAPIILTMPPLLAGLLSGYRRPLALLFRVAVLTSVLTLLITVVVTRISGISTGLVEPIINRSVAGWLAATIMNRVLAAGSRPEVA
jgi:hypothetical protein